MSDRGSNAVRDAKQARAVLEERLEAVERAKAEYHDAVRAAWAAGVPLRAIAEELGLSHQRVHQMVSEEPAADRRTNRRRIARTVLSMVSLWALRVVVVLLVAGGASVGATHAALALAPQACADVATGVALVCEGSAPRFAVYATVGVAAVAAFAVAVRLRAFAGKRL